MGFFKSFFSGKQEKPETEKQKNDQKNFEIFKYDGMRAQRMGRPDYAIKCFTEALALQEDFETMSYLSQMAGLTVQNFVSAATGIALAMALIRGFARKSANGIGNFWVDLTRCCLYVLLPISTVFALFLVWQGVPQTFAQYVSALTLQGVDQVIPLGPAASQIAIKQLGTNGGGFFGVNSAHPFENPNGLSNLIEVCGIALLPLALVVAFGRLVGNLVSNAMRYAKTVRVEARHGAKWRSSAVGGAKLLPMRFGRTVSDRKAIAPAVVSGR